MEKLILTMADGCIGRISGPEGLEIEIRDYDVPRDWDEDDKRCRTDDEGDRYQFAIIEAVETEITDDQKCVGCEEPYSEDSINGGRCTNCGRMI